MLDDVLKIATLPEMAAGTAQNGFQAVASSWAPFWAWEKRRNNVIIFIYCSAQ
jgi:transketolase C-terminal domain/subunit